MKPADNARIFGLATPHPAFRDGAIGQAIAAMARQQTRLPVAYIPMWRRLVLPGLLAAAAVILSMFFVDAPVNIWTSSLPRWFVNLFEEISDFGRSAWILVPVGALIVVTAILASRSVDRLSRAVLALVVVRLGFVFVAVGLPGLLSTIIKRWIGRVRPSDQGPFAYEPFSWRPDFASLPSGHATTAFAALVAIGAVYPRVRPALWAYALLIGASRIVVDAHYPSDVIAGAVAGVFGALLVRDWMAQRRLGFFVASDGRVRTKSGPSLQRLKRIAAGAIAP